MNVLNYWKSKKEQNMDEKKTKSFVYFNIIITLKF